MVAGMKAAVYLQSQVLNSISVTTSEIDKIPGILIPAGKLQARR
jgi:hypothetical protein